MDVRQIVAEYLKQHGMDGLACDGCGCGLDDLMPCSDLLTNAAMNCKPAKKHVCDGTCSGCCATPEEAAAGTHACYRSAIITAQNQEEELHL